MILQKVLTSVLIAALCEFLYTASFNPVKYEACYCASTFAYYTFLLSHFRIFKSRKCPACYGEVMCFDRTSSRSTGSSSTV